MKMEQLPSPFSPDPIPDPLPKYSASGRPVTWAERFAFNLWILMFLFVLVITLIFYLADKLFA
jgi:hypothetical protein